MNRFAIAVVLLLPLAAAGAADAPEVTDAEGDATCYGPVGNEYADIVSAWIDGETEDMFMVNIALAKWTADALGTAVGYTLQFSHQGVQYGAIAAYIPEPVGGGWEYDNGYIDTETGEFGDWQDAEGTFTPGTPAVISIEFSKSLFPHGDSTDNRLINFNGGSADFKNWAPFFVLPADPAVPFQLCDDVESAAVYEFTVGAHSQHGSAPMEGEDSGTDTTDAADPAADDAPEDVLPAATEKNDTPAPSIALVVAAIGAFALLRRRL